MLTLKQAIDKSKDKRQSISKKRVLGVHWETKRLKNLGGFPGKIEKISTPKEISLVLLKHL